MRRFFFIGVAAGLLAALIANGQPHGNLNIGGQGGHLNVPLGGALLYVATSGRSQPTSIDTSFCTTYASELTGASAFCMDETGTFSGAYSGSFGETGTVEDSNRNVCPNGADCTQYASQRFSSGNYYAADAGSWQPAAFSFCAFVNPDQISGITQRIVNRDNVGTGKRSATITLASIGTYATGVYGDGGTAAPGAPASGTPAAGKWDFLCLTSTNASSILYVNGTAGATSTVAYGVPYDYSDLRMAVAANSAGIEHFLGRMGAVFVTEKVLSSDTITSMAAALKPGLKDSKGNAVTTTRASIRSCFNAAGDAGSILAYNEECVDDQNRLHVWGSHSNLIARSTEIEQWVAGNTPTESANYGFAPDGTKTSDLIGDDDGAGSEYEQQSYTATAGAAYTFSCWLKAGTSSSLQMYHDGTACNTTITSEWARYSCTDESASGVGPVVRLYPGYAGAASDTGNIEVWGCQVNSGSTVVPFVPTYATVPVTAAADNVAITTPANFPGTEGCAKICITPSWTGAAPADAYFLTGSSGQANTRMFYLTTGGTSLAAANGATFPAVAMAATADTRQCYRLQWSASANSTRMDNITSGTQGTPAAFSSWATAFGASMVVGSYNGSTYPANSYIDGIVLDNKPTGCQ